MEPAESLQINPLFGALTRPAMTMGVTLEYHGLNLIVSVCTFIALNNLFYAAIFLPLHLIGVAICQLEPRFFTIAAACIQLPAMPNQVLWGVRSYEP